ncbi:fimbria/pilus outer membrane usher protein [Providencia rettgeri]|uniref:fimbria/pilus outer membrane usher protein n=1 Tax=Providencia TaxID=586 RepID=UPI00109D7F6C|nr:MULTISPECIES: fimbria/pilus outer membrane usher protein [Providencia]MBQ0530762.1 fimbria/pilus outer membrane usher protein [Providencia rettgeri]THB28196.1 fimbrial assembly protein [Providencia sp. MGF014]WOB86782.1 fimbria/pilus outer membrane usher protein [Providencia sp. PROV040]
MVFKTNEKLKLAWLIAFLLPSFIGWKAFATEFNTDVLDADDMQNIDMSQFSVAGYTLPGDYVFTLFVNGQRLGAPRNISVYENKPIAGESAQATQTICIPPDILELIGLKRSAMEKVTLSHSGKCLDFSALSGVQTAIELSTLSLKMTIPQIWMEYRDPYWVPANLWEEGIGGAFIDYNANISATKETNSNRQIYLSSNGITGVNWGAWRLRGDYSTSYQKQRGDYPQEKHDFDFTRLYAFTSLKDSASIFTLGENYFYSDIFESWQYTGFSLESDDRMLPPKLVGYAPEIIGVANTNAIVIVRSQERIISETAVPPGPFRIQTLDSGIRGVLDVTVREENGEESKFSLSTASLPYLTRPGRVIYKVAMGKTRYDNRHLTGEPVVSGELSYGVSNAWSLYGGTQLNGYYQSAALGIGRDLFSIGAVSFDITQSFADFSDKRRQGRSYRVNYAKSFDELRTDITFAGYRFADKEYRTLTQFMDEERIGYGTQAAKENYQLYLNKYFDDFNISLNYQYSTYWQHDSQTQYGLYINAPLNFPLLSQNAANLSLSATRTERDNGNEEDAINLYLTVPLFRGHSITFSELYSRSAGNNQFNHQVGYSGYGEQDNYNINVGYNHGQHIDNQVSLSGFYSRDISQASTSINASYVPDQYHSIGGSINGGLTLTSKGAALHRSAHGDTRLMVETPDVSGIPLDNGVIKTNAFGLAVIPNVNSYRKSTASINTSQLPDDIESLDPSTDITLTKGAIGYRSLSVMKGHKLFVVFALSDGKHPPFGASVRNKNNQEVGLVGEGGVTWLVGVSPQEKLSLYWNNQPQCELSLPEKLNELTDLLLLPCSSAKAVRSVYSSSSK